MLRRFSSFSAVLLVGAVCCAEEAKPQAAGEPAAAQPAVQQDAKPVETDLHAVEAKVLERTNVERTRRGLRPLALHRPLLRSARRHCAWMTRSRSLQHTSAPVAENIAMGQRSADEAVTSWMNSPGHRANMLNASYSKIGVSAYRTADGTTYWCQQFLR